MKTVRTTYYGVEGEGRTLTEAKADAGRKLTAMTRGEWAPVVLTYRGKAVLIARHPFYGWGWRFIVDGSGIRGGEVHLNLAGTGRRTQAEASREAAYNLAQQTWESVDGTAMPQFVDHEDRGDWLRWVQFQQRYEAAILAGLLDGDAHTYACGSLGRPDLEERVKAAA